MQKNSRLLDFGLYYLIFFYIKYSGLRHFLVDLMVFLGIYTIFIAREEQKLYDIIFTTVLEVS